MFAPGPEDPNIFLEWRAVGEEMGPRSVERRIPAYRKAPVQELRAGFIFFLGR